VLPGFAALQTPHAALTLVLPAVAEVVVVLLLLLLHPCQLAV
jgi:hypothetical protein